MWQHQSNLPSLPLSKHSFLPKMVHSIATVHKHHKQLVDAVVSVANAQSNWGIEHLIRAVKKPTIHFGSLSYDVSNLGCQEAEELYVFLRDNASKMPLILNYYLSVIAETIIEFHGDWEENHDTQSPLLIDLYSSIVCEQFFEACDGKEEFNHIKNLAILHNNAFPDDDNLFAAAAKCEWDDSWDD